MTLFDPKTGRLVTLDLKPAGPPVASDTASAGDQKVRPDRSPRPRGDNGASRVSSDIGSRGTEPK